MTRTTINFFNGSIFLNLRNSIWIILLLLCSLTSISYAGNAPVHTLRENKFFMDIDSNVKYFIDSLNDFSSQDLGTNDFNAKYKEKLFGLYQRVHDHVTGKCLGLYLVKTQVEALGGTILSDSKAEISSTFIISLPNIS